MNHQRQLDVSENSRTTHFDPFQFPPQCLAIAINEWLCNYRCKQCHTWMQKTLHHTANGSNLPIELKVDICQQFKKLNPHGTVHFYGGEPFLAMDEILTLAKACQRLNLFNFTVSNGSLIRTPEIAERIISAGLKLVVISLDSHQAEIHEYLRGIKGCFEKTVESIRFLQQAAQKLNPSFQITINTIIFNQNVDEFESFIEFCRDLGVKNVSGVLLERTFNNTNPHRDVFFEKHFWHTPDEKAHAKQRITDIVHQYADDPFVSFDTIDLKWMLQYIDDPDFTTAEPICGSHEYNFIINTSGNVMLCFCGVLVNAENPFIGNVNTQTIQEIWSSARAQEIRHMMNECSYNCGALPCHRKRSF